LGRFTITASMGAVRTSAVRCSMSAKGSDSSRFCKSCQSTNQSTFNGEIALHFPGLSGLDKPIVWVFPKLVVCLNCGFTEFSIPEAELQTLSHGHSHAA
jgi:predicted nucleic-acid-binding Zn-ribbon protein